jgi:hypothetical protein
VKLHELFDKPLPYTKEDDRNYFFSYKGVDYELRLDNHTLEEKDVPPEIIESINFDNTITIKLGIQDSDDPSRIANFEENDIKFKVLATVYDIIYKYIIEHQPEAVLLKSFDEPSRIRFYDTLSDKLAEKFNYKKDAKNGLFTLYDESLEKGSENLNEAIDQAVDFELKENDTQRKSYVFKIEGEETEIKFTKLDPAIIEYSNADVSNFYSVVFYVDNKINTSKSGVNQNTFKIFATLKTIVENFIDDFNPTGLWAAANTHKKSSIYKKLIKGKIESEFERVVDDNKELAVYNTNDEQTIHEAFDKTVDFRKKISKNNYKIYEFYAGENKIKVLFNKTALTSRDFNRLEVDDINIYKIDFEVDNRTRKSFDSYNENTFIIGSTILEILKTFIAEENPSGIEAVGNSNKKTQLYEKLLKSKVSENFEEFHSEGKRLLLYNKTDNKT